MNAAQRIRIEGQVSASFEAVCFARRTPMTTETSKACCPKFDPAPWDGKTLTWHQKRFVKDHVTSFLHIPLNLAACRT